MSVKILIKRQVPQDKGRLMIPLFRKMRELAIGQPGYISGETLRNLNKPNEFLVISSWNSSEEWSNWLKNPNRKKIQDEIDVLLGGDTDYEIFHYGFTE